MTTVPIDLASPGPWDRRLLPPRDRRRRCALRLRTRRVVHRLAEGQARRARPARSRTSVTCSSPTSISTTRAAAGVLVREHPALQVTSRRSGRRTSSTRRSSMRARAAVCTETRSSELWGELAAHPVRERPPRRRDRRRARVLPNARPRLAPRVVPRRRRDALCRATRRASASTSGRFVMPPCPPPELDLEAWEETIVEIERRAPSRLALVHFGVFDDVQRAPRRVARHDATPLGERVEDGMDEGLSSSSARGDVSQTGPRARRRLRSCGRRTGTTSAASSATGASAARRQRRAKPANRVRLGDLPQRRRTRSADACVGLEYDRWRDTRLRAPPCQRAATTHQRSPGLRPGNSHCGCGVTEVVPR